MCSETDKKYMRVAMMIDGSIHQTYEFSDEAIQRATESQVQNNLEARSKEDDFRMTHNADDAYFDKQYDKPAPLRDLLQNNHDDWDNFINGHLGAYIDFQNWLKDQYFNKKDDALVRIVDRAIKEIE